MVLMATWTQEWIIQFYKTLLICISCWQIHQAKIGRTLLKGFWNHHSVYIFPTWFDLTLGDDSSHHENFICRHSVFNDPRWSGWGSIEFPPERSNAPFLLQLKVANIEYWCVLCPNLGRYYDYVSKISLQISTLCSASDMFGPTQLRNLFPGLLSGRCQARPPGQRYLTKCLATNNFPESSGWVKLTLHSLIGNWTLVFSCFWSFNIQIPGLLVTLIIWWVRFQCFYSQGLHDITKKPSESSNKSDKSSLSSCLDPAA